MKQILRKTTALLAIAAMLFGAMGVSLAAETNAVSDVRHSVVVVNTGFEVTGGEWLSLGTGTGFFVGDGDAQYLITNHHVVEGFVELGSGEPITVEGISGRMKLRVYYDSGTFEEAYLVDYDAIKDIALLRLASPTDRRVPLKLLVPDNTMVPSRVYAVGFPGMADNWITDSVSTWGENDVTFSEGTLSRLMITSGTGVSTIQTDTVIMPGNSGGPLVSAEGAVLGINTFTISNTSGDEMYYAVNIEEVLPMLRLHDVSFALYEEEPEPAPAPAEDENAEAAETQGEAEEEEPAAAAVTEEDKGGTNWTVVIIVAIVAVAAIAIIVAAGKKKKAEPAAQAAATPVPPTGPAPTPQPAPRPAPQPAPNADDSGFRVQGISGPMEGKRFMVARSRELVFGRDAARCGVALPANTPGVSGSHCAVYAEGDTVYLKDLGSTHGTFIAPGRRLAANQPIPLRPGETFWLGSESVSFVIAERTVR